MALTSAVPAPVREFLPEATPAAWLISAESRLPELLNDHANCELKAASTALGFIYRYPELTALCTSMSRIAREELRHFEQVRKVMRTRGVGFARLSASRYAGALRDAVRKPEPHRLLDSLLVGALIEARSCERFAALIPRLDASLARFYSGLLASEARHFQNYLELAEHLCQCDRTEINARLGELKAIESDLVKSPDDQFRFHSGPPRT